jgi:hypothetical protein
MFVPTLRIKVLLLWPGFLSNPVTSRGPVTGAQPEDRGSNDVLPPGTIREMVKLVDCIINRGNTNNVEHIPATVPVNP